MITGSLQYVIWFYMAVTVSALAAWPAAVRAFPPKAAWGAARFLGFFVPAAAAFLASALAGPVAGDIAAGICLVGMAAMWLFPSQRRNVNLKSAVEIEIWTLFAFAALVFIRAWCPSIVGQEKFADMAIMSSSWKSGAVPPPDPWLAGYPVNYYFFSHFLWGKISFWLCIRPDITYQLALSFILTVGLGLFISIARTIGARLEGRLLAVAFFLGGNLVWIKKLFLGTGPAGLWWDSSRAGTGIITEFPFFSFLLGDLHAHYAALPIEIFLFLCWMTIFKNREKDRLIYLSFFAGTALGILTAANQWSVPLHAACAVAATVIMYRRKLLPPIAFFLIPAAVFSLTFQFNYVSPFAISGGISSRIAVVSFLRQDPAWIVWLHFGTLLIVPCAWIFSVLRMLVKSGIWWTVLFTVFLIPVIPVSVPFLLLSAATFYESWKGKVEDRSEAVLVAVCFLFLVCVEILCVRDFMGGKLFRMNSIFKFFYQAWLFLAVVNLTVVAVWKTRWMRYAVPVVLALSAVYPMAAVPGRLGLEPSREELPSLDGMRFMKTGRLKGDRECIEWIRDNVTSNSILIESTGKPFSLEARVSSFSGVPSYLGWRNHEFVWRGPDILPELDKREKEINNFYSLREDEKLRSTAKRLGIDIIFLGSLERAKYRPCISCMEKAFNVLYKGKKCEVLGIR